MKLLIIRNTGSMNHALVAAALLVGGIAASAQSPCLIASYTFNGNANDVTGNGHDGTVFGATPAIDRFGNANSCYQFDGIDDFIDITGDWTTGGSNGTFSAYIYLDDLDDYRPVFTHVDNPNIGNALVINIDPSFSPDPGWLWFAVDQRECLGGPTLYFTETQPQPQVGEWIHIAVTADDDSVHLYLNCVEVETYLPDGLTNPGLWFEDLCSGSFTTLIGRSASISFKGRIDDVKIFNCALSAAELDSLCQPDFSTGLAQQTSDHQLIACPNPSNRLTRISGLPLMSDRNVLLVDATGRTIPIVPQWQGLDLVLDLTNLRPGVYTAVVDGCAVRMIRE